MNAWAKTLKQHADSNSKLQVREKTGYPFSTSLIPPLGRLVRRVLVPGCRDHRKHERRMGHLGCLYFQNIPQERVLK